MNKATEVFNTFLDVIEFELVKYEDGYGLVDLQGANLGDIEEDRFQTAAEIIERLSVYIEDYYLDDLDEEFCNTVEAYGFEVTENMKHSTPEEWCDFAKFPHSCKGVEKFIADHRHEFDVLDMIVNHADEVHLDELTACSEGGKG